MKQPKLNPDASDETIKRVLVDYATNSAGDDNNALFIVQQLAQVRANVDDQELLFRAIMRFILPKTTIDWYVHEYIRS